MPDATSLWITGLTGGLAGAIINQMCVWLARFWVRPILTIDFANDVEGCLVTGLPVSTRVGEKTATYIRLRVTNRGLSSATDVQMVVVAIDAAGRTFTGEVLDLLWSNSDDLTKMDVPSQTWRFADLCSMIHPADGHLRLCATGAPNSRLQSLPASGTFQLTVSAVAANARTTTKTIRFQADQANDQLSIL